MLNLNNNFLSQIKYLKHNHILILCYLYNWVAGANSPKLKQIDDSGFLYFYIFINKIAGDLSLSRKQVQDALFRLENRDKKIQTTLQPFIIPKMNYRENRLYIALNPAMIPFVLADDKKISVLQKKLGGNSYNVSKVRSNNMSALFDDGSVKKGFTVEAENLVKEILNENKDVFTTRIPQDITKSKTYMCACRYVQDLWNGSFASCRENQNNYKIGESEWFDTDDWKEKIKAVKGDWNKVEELLNQAVANYKLMFQPENMPFSKDNLPKSFEKWLYDSWSFGFDNPISYFVLSLNKPNETKKQLSENKADRIYKELSGKAKKYGDKLYQKCNGGYAGTFFENIKKMVEWGDEVCKIDNAGYWISSGADLVKKFAEYCESRNVQISPTTVDVQRSIQCFAPFAWFVKEGCAEHNIDSRIIDCGTVDELRGLKNQKKKIKLDDLIF